MASLLCVCTNCGQYSKGASISLFESYKNHTCELNLAQVKKNMIECKAILSSLAENEVKYEALSNDQTNLTAPPPPPPPPPPSPQPHHHLSMVHKEEAVLFEQFRKVHEELKQKLVGRAEQVEKAQAAEEASRKVEEARKSEESRKIGKSLKRKRPVSNTADKRNRKN